MKFTSEELGEHHVCTEFACGHPDLDGWLRDHAPHAAAMNTGRTFVWHAGDAVVQAYFTLAAHLVAREAVPQRIARGSPTVIPAILLARLALDGTLHGQGLGAELLWDAMSRAVAANRQAAARLVVVDAIDGRAAAFYAHYGFRPTEGNSLRLIQKLNAIASALD